jgi:hypothetical protein
MKLIALLPTLAASILFCNCLPGDIRPTPGQVILYAEPGAAMLEGISTEDGWSIVFERFLVGIGGGEIEGDACNQYANARYGRLFDMVVPGTQKVCELYGLGTCEIELLLRPPPKGAILENGVTTGDLAFMLLPDETNPLPMENGPFGPMGSSVFARGAATRDGITKRFEWKFPGRFPVRDCANTGDTTYTSTVILHANDALRPIVSIHGEELFRIRPDSDAPLRFNAFADADMDGDDVITSAELVNAPAPVAEVDGGIPDAGIDDAGTPGMGMIGASMAAFLGRTMLPRIVYLTDRPCRKNF